MTINESDQDKKRLIENIRAEAEAEAEKIRVDTERAIAALVQSHSAQIERIEAEEVRRAEEQIAQLEKRAHVAESVAHRRRDLAVKSTVINEITRRVEERFRELRGSDAYREALTDWIVEGVVGLGADNVTVAAAPEEGELARAVFAEAARRAKEITGRSVSLSLAERPHGGSGGVLINDKDASRAFDNRVGTRLMRYRNQIQRMIHQRLFAS